MSYTRADLEEMDKLYKKADASGETKEGSALPEGRYQAKILKADLRVSQAGVMMAYFQYEVVGGNADLIGEKGDSYEGLRDAQNMGYFVKKLKRLGMKFDSFKEVPALLKGLIGSIVEIQVKHSKDGQFVNIYANKMIKPADEPTEDSEADEQEDEEAEETTSKAASEESEDADEAEEDEEEAEETTEEDEEEDPSPRKHPTQEKLASIKESEIDEILADFQVKYKKLDLKAKLATARALVAAMYDDDTEEFELRDLNRALSAVGKDAVEKPKAGWRALVSYIANLE